MSSLGMNTEAYDRTISNVHEDFYVAHCLRFQNWVRSSSYVEQVRQSSKRTHIL